MECRLKRYLNQYVFQMRLSDSRNRVGWLTSDEGVDAQDQYTPYFTIPWQRAVADAVDGGEYILVGKNHGELTAFRMRRQGDLLSGDCNGTLIRMMLTSDRSGLVGPLPYVGRRLDVLAQYGFNNDSWFLPLLPIDLDRMDRLYLQSKVVLVGITPRFGPHVEADARHWQALGIRPPLHPDSHLMVKLVATTEELLHIGRATDLILYAPEEQRRFLLQRLREGDATLNWFLTRGTLINPSLVTLPGGVGALIESAADVLRHQQTISAETESHKSGRLVTPAELKGSGGFTQI